MKHPEAAKEMPQINLPAQLAVTTDAYARSLGADAENADPAVRLAADVQRSTAEAWNSLNEMRSNRNPVDTPAKHLDRLQDAATRMDRNITARTDRARDLLRSRREALEREIREVVNGTPTEDTAEIRAVLRDMPENERVQAIQKAIADGDRGTLNAVFSGRPVTVGLDAKALEAMRVQAGKQLAPELHKQLEQVDKANKLMLDLVDSHLRTMQDAAGSKEVRDAFIKRALAADQAALRFDAALKEQS